MLLQCHQQDEEQAKNQIGNHVGFSARERRGHRHPLAESFLDGGQIRNTE
jgi:hypothetical protein